MWVQVPPCAQILGCSQMVRHKILILICVGSIPTTLANNLKMHYYIGMNRAFGGDRMTCESGLVRKCYLTYGMIFKSADLVVGEY